MPLQHRKYPLKPNANLDLARTFALFLISRETQYKHGEYPCCDILCAISSSHTLHPGFSHALFLILMASMLSASSPMLDKCDGAAYVLMVNIYAAVGMPEKAKDIEAMRIRNKAWKLPGNG